VREIIASAHSRNWQDVAVFFWSRDARRQKVTIQPDEHADRRVREGVTLHNRSAPGAPASGAHFVLRSTATSSRLCLFARLSTSHWEAIWSRSTCSTPCMGCLSSEYSRPSSTSRRALRTMIPSRGKPIKDVAALHWSEPGDQADYFRVAPFPSAIAGSSEDNRCGLAAALTIGTYVGDSERATGPAHAKAEALERARDPVGVGGWGGGHHSASSGSRMVVSCMGVPLVMGLCPRSG
jgi:hypothetical protein